MCNDVDHLSYKQSTQAHKNYNASICSNSFLSLKATSANNGITKKASSAHLGVWAKEPQNKSSFLRNTLHFASYPRARWRHWRSAGRCWCGWWAERGQQGSSGHWVGRSCCSAGLVGDLLWRPGRGDGRGDWHDENFTECHICKLQKKKRGDTWTAKPTWLSKD